MAATRIHQFDRGVPPTIAARPSLCETGRCHTPAQYRAQRNGPPRPRGTPETLSPIWCPPPCRSACLSCSPSESTRRRDQMPGSRSIECRTSIGLMNRRTCSASPVASRCADGSDKPKLRLASRFELSDAISALRLRPKAVATVSGPTVRHPEVVTRLQRIAFPSFPFERNQKQTRTPAKADPCQRLIPAKG
jgi:hypothetical protein